MRTFTVQYMRDCLQKTEMEEFTNDIHKFKEFLLTFSKEHNEPLKDNDILPHRLLSFFLVEEEVEAEVADWVTQYLTAEKAPNLLTSLLSRTIRDDVMTWDLKPYIESMPMSQDDDINDDQADRSSDTTEILEESDGSPKIEVYKLAKDVFNRLHEICKEWSEDFPKDLSKNLPQSTKFTAISSYAIKNTRRKMEDRHVVFPYLNQHCGLDTDHEQSFFGVYDGHGGTETAMYVSAHLHHNLTKDTNFNRDPQQALKSAFTKTDKDFIQKAKRENLRSGSTCVCALIRDSKLHVAWLGDSQIMMVKDGLPIIMMDPHKPERDDERKRIEGLGGFVMWFGQWRVNATLSVSRAIGDADFKPFVSGDADIAEFNLTGDEDYMVLACDGLWDTLSYEDVSNVVYDYLNNQKGDKQKVAEILVNKAKDKGSSDNISATVVFFRDTIGEPRPMPKAERRVVMTRDEKPDDTTEKEESENDNDQVDEEKKKCEDKSAGDVAESTQLKSQDNITDVSLKKPHSSNVNTSVSRNYKTDIKLASSSAFSWSYPASSSRKPLSSCSIVNTPVTYQKPAPYSVYKVLLTHKHKTKVAALASTKKLESENEGQMKQDETYQHLDTFKSYHKPSVTEKGVEDDTIESIKNNEEQKPNPSSLNISTVATKYLCLSDRQSEASSTDIAGASESSKKCVASRKVIKKGKNGKRRNIHRNLRRLSRDRLSLGIAERTKSSNSSSSSPRSFKPKAKALAAKYVTGKTCVNREKLSVKVKSGDSRGKVVLYPGSSRVPYKWEDDQLHRVVTGMGHMDISPTSPESKWTVAREIENAAAMFGE